ncbi:MAG: hypothetical protein V7646_4993 [Pseudonocardia sp.]|jgi:hypothetical protein
MSAFSKIAFQRPPRRRWHKPYYDRFHHYHKGYWENY